MPDISLTDFVDFVISAGTPRLTKVQQIKSRPEYSPAFDFWKPLREALRDYHRSGSQNKNDLNNVLIELSDPKKTRRYPAAIMAYKKFLGRKRITWFDPPSDLWTFSGLGVRVNPELGLCINGQNYIIKLYFKDEAPTKNRLQTVLQMMHSTLSSQVTNGAAMAVLDVANGKLTSNTAQPNIAILIQGEASAFVQMWNSI
jgi:hypothetical protein